MWSTGFSELKFLEDFFEERKSREKDQEGFIHLRPQKFGLGLLEKMPLTLMLNIEFLQSGPRKKIVNQVFQQKSLVIKMMKVCGLVCINTSFPEHKLTLQLFEIF